MEGKRGQVSVGPAQSQTRASPGLRTQAGKLTNPDVKKNSDSTPCEKKRGGRKKGGRRNAPRDGVKRAVAGWQPKWWDLERETAAAQLPQASQPALREGGPRRERERERPDRRAASNGHEPPPTSHRRRREGPRERRSPLSLSHTHTHSPMVAHAAASASASASSL